MPPWSLPKHWSVTRFPLCRGARRPLKLWHQFRRRSAPCVTSGSRSGTHPMFRSRPYRQKHWPRNERTSPPPAPAWFAALIAPPVDSRRVAVVSEGRPLGSIVLSSAPGDEIAEVWDNATALAKVATVIGVGGIGVLHLLFG